MATFSNQAALSYRGIRVDSNVVSGEILEVISASKTALRGEYTVGSEISYLVNIVNSGNTDVNGIVLTDDLGGYTFGTETLYPLEYVAGSLRYFVEGELETGPAAEEGPPLVISGIDVPANSVVTVAYTARVNEFAPPSDEGQITNTARLNGNGIRDISVEETVGAEASPILDITKTASPLSVEENGELSFTLIIQNRGNAATAPGDNVTVSDMLDPVLSNIRVYYNGELWSSPEDYSYDETTGSFVTAAGAVSVPAASFTQDAVTGEWIAEPGTAVITIIGTV